MSKIVILRLLDTFFRHRWLYLIPIGLMAIAAGIYVYQQQSLYMASGVIFTERTSLLSSLTAVDQEGFSWKTPAQDTAGQISDLTKTDAFIRAVIGETDLEAEMSRGGSAADDLISSVRPNIFAWVAGNNQVQVTAVYDDPRIAYQLAQSTINTFILWNINLDRTDSVTAEVFFQDLIRGYQADVLTAQETLRTYLETHPKPDVGDRPDTETFEIQNLQANVNFAASRLAHAAEKAEDARLANVQIESNVRQKYMVVDAPDIPSDPATSKRKMAKAAAMFLAAGTLLSAIAVVGATVFDQTFRLPVEVPQILSLPVLALVTDVSVPAPGRSWKRKRKEPVQERQREPILGKPEEARALPIAHDDLPAPDTGQSQNQVADASGPTTFGIDPKPEQ
jgi:hypothetical protein